LRVLYFSKSSGWEHDVVKRVDGAPSYSEKILASLGAKQGIEFTFSKDGSLFTSAYLAPFDAVLFYTSGDLFSVGTDGQPAMTPAGRQALFDYVAGGKGFVGLHSASDTFLTGEHGGGNPEIRLARYRDNGAAADPYGRFLGGAFIRHNVQQVAVATVPDQKFPGFSGLGAGLKVMEEWYTLKEFAPDLHVLLVLQTAGMQGPDYLRPPFPLAWVRPYGKGRVAYTALGHREDVWDSAAFQAMLTGLLEWAAGRISAEVTPNLAQVAPDAAKTQVPPADVK
jgi:hypothetical protein